MVSVAILSIPTYVPLEHHQTTFLPTDYYILTTHPNRAAQIPLANLLTWILCCTTYSPKPVETTYDLTYQPPSSGRTIAYSLKNPASWPELAT